MSICCLREMEAVLLLAPYLDKHLVLLLLEHHHKVRESQLFFLPHQCRA